jgi:hypothetical protein
VCVSSAAFLLIVDLAEGTADEVHSGRVSRGGVVKVLHSARNHPIVRPHYRRRHLEPPAAGARQAAPPGNPHVSITHTVHTYSDPAPYYSKGYLCVLPVPVCPKANTVTE